nr:ABC transporter permease [Cognatiyoonia koreensis]
MDLSAINPILFFASMMVAATPILLAGLGELVVERAGVLNLGVEGMMIVGAVCGFIMATNAGSAWVGFAGAAIGGALLSLIFAVLTQYLLSNQVATGLALTLFGLGLSASLGQSYIGIKGPAFPDWHIPVLGDIPVIGPIVFQHDPIVYLGLLLTFGVWVFLKYSRAGLILRAVGENHEAAHALGYKVVRVRILAILFGGACAGLGGAYLSLVRVPQWTEGMTAGAGWIALAIVVFASWKPGRLVLGAYLFGGVTALQLNLQAASIPLLPLLVLIAGVSTAVLLVVALFKPTGARKSPLIGAACAAAFMLLCYAYVVMGWPFNQTLWLSSSPYLATIVVLVVMSAGRAPGSLGRIFHASR